MTTGYMRTICVLMALKDICKLFQSYYYSAEKENLQYCHSALKVELTAYCFCYLDGLVILSPQTLPKRG